MTFHPEPGLEVANRYRLTRRIGGGVLGILWEGVSLDDGHPVLLELLRSEGMGQEAVSHVWRAAMLIERIDHEGAVGIEDVVGGGPATEMVPIAVVPFVRGADLDRWLRERPRTLREAVAVMREVVDVLESAHRAVDVKGHDDPLTHLGLKPSEVIVGEDAYRGPRLRKMHVRVLDFGRVRDHVEEDETGTVTSVSSPRFESPEMFAYPEFEGPWSDVWSVGVMLYVLASGRYPFGQDSDTPFLLQHHILDQPCIPLHVLDERIPSDFARLVDRCLSKNPSERFEDARLLGLGLDALPALDPTLSAHPFPTTRKSTPRAGEHILDALEPLASAPTNSRPPPSNANRMLAAFAAIGLVAGGTGIGLITDSPSSTSASGASALRVGSTMPSRTVTTTIAAALVSADPYDTLAAENPFRPIRAPDASHTLGCDREPPSANIEVESSVDQVAVRRTVVARGVLAGLSRSSVCPVGDRRDAEGRCWVTACPPNSTGPDETGRCTTSRYVRAPIQRCFRPETARPSLAEARRVTLQEHEVTWAELGRFVRLRHHSVFLATDPTTAARRSATWDGVVDGSRTSLPAHGVPRGLAVAYCEAIHARLPTEAEFETAARGPHFASAPWGHSSVELGTQLHALGAHDTVPAAVRDITSLDRTIADAPIFDLVGNVREWTMDAYLPDAPQGAASNAIELASLASNTGVPLTLGVVRGLPLAMPDGWPNLSRARGLQSLLPVPAAYRAGMCAESGASLDRPGACVASASRYLASLYDVGFRCARDGE